MEKESPGTKNSPGKYCLLNGVLTFPSGKHCNKFLRTGNILLHSAEIFFIAFCLLDRFSPERHLHIFCDTSSINSLAFALQELKRRILHSKAKEYRMVPVVSFSSYEGLVKGNNIRLENSLILVSASTSANILDRIIKAHPIVNIENIKILYFLGPPDVYNSNRNQILCNLTHAEGNCNGIPLYPTFSAVDCEFCQNGSYPAKINGDVFMPENPRVNRIIFTVRDAPSGLNNFLRQFQSSNKNSEHFFKVNYKEGTNQELQYEIYMDMFLVITSLNKGTSRYKEFRAKLDDYINQYIPSNVRYLICLPDEGSAELAKYILSLIQDNYAKEKIPVILKFDEISNIDENAIGASVIVASCISNGKNLLYLSRALRKYDDNLKLIYFVGMARMTNEDSLGFLKSNLKQGKYGKETNSFYAVEQFYCTNDVKQTTWLKELEFLKTFKDYVDIHWPGDNLIGMLDERIELLEDSMSDQQKGLSNRLFFPSVCDGKDLVLRKNYAFLSYKNYHEHVSQADVYFTISAIFNKLRNNKEERKLKQSEYFRNLIDPNNFNRFNDGIIQASILRGAHTNELCYHIDNTLSLEMRGILETIIRHQNSEQGEALLEFLYALASGKMTLVQEHLLYICDLVLAQVKEPLADKFSWYIKSEVISDHVKQIDLKAENAQLREEIKRLKSNSQKSY